MKKYSILLVLIFILSFPEMSLAGIFSMSSAQKKDGTVAEAEPSKVEDQIPVQDSLDKLIIKRRDEARKLIEEGKKLIKRGEKKNNKSLIVKGQIKKEIGEKQIKLLKEQQDSKKREETNDNW